MIPGALALSCFAWAIVAGVALAWGAAKVERWISRGSVR